MSDVNKAQSTCGAFPLESLLPTDLATKKIGRDIVVVSTADSTGCINIHYQGDTRPEAIICETPSLGPSLSVEHDSFGTWPQAPGYTKMLDLGTYCNYLSSCNLLDDASKQLCPNTDHDNLFGVVSIGSGASLIGMVEAASSATLLVAPLITGGIFLIGLGLYVLFSD